MLTLLLILIIIACVLLVIIILAQNPKGGGLSNIGSGASQFLGARQTADFLEKSTWYFGIGILVVVIFTYFLTTGSPDTSSSKKSRTEGVEWNGNVNNPAPAKKPAATPGANPTTTPQPVQEPK
jgi:preprotein translocase subunit SecG